MKYIMASLLALSLAACGEPSPERQAENARLMAISYGQMSVESTLRDPSSVQWEWKAINLDNNAMCYIYRARNGFGGMGQGYAVIVDGVAHHNKSKTFDKYCGNGGGKYETY